jgi:hypothetical protein
VLNYGGEPMAVFQVRCANTVVRIHDVDHPPPHCHVKIDGRDVRVLLATLAVWRSNYKLSPKLRKCLEKHQAAMLAAWEDVTIQ